MIKDKHNSSVHTCSYSLDSKLVVAIVVDPGVESGAIAV